MDLIRAIIFSVVLSTVSCSDMYNDTREITGQWKWTRMYGTVGATLHIRSAAVDNAGNVYLGGNTDKSGNNDWIIIKYDSAGKLIWEKIYASSAEDYLYKLIIGKDGNAYAVGSTNAALFLGATSSESGSGYDMVIVKFDADFNPLWTRIYGGTGYGEEAYSVTLDSKLNVYVAGVANSGFNGQSVASPGISDPVIIKLDKNGTLVKTMIRAVGNANYYYDITVDYNDNIIAVGNATDGMDGQAYFGNVDIMVSKFDPSLNFKATRIMGSTGTDNGYNVTTDYEGNIYVAGNVYGYVYDQPYSGDYDGVILKYDSSMNLKWVRQIGTGGNDCAATILTDCDGNLLVAGCVGGYVGDHSFSGVTDAFLAKYSPAGERSWISVRGGNGYDMADIIGMAFNPDGAIYTAGMTGSPEIDGQTLTGINDLLLIKYQ